MLPHVRFLTSLALLCPAAVQGNIAITQVDYYIASEDLRIRLLPEYAEVETRCVIRRVGNAKPLGIPIGEMKFPVFVPLAGKGTDASESLWAVLGPNPYRRWHPTAGGWKSDTQNMPDAGLDKALAFRAEFDGRRHKPDSIGFSKPGAVEDADLLPAPLPGEAAVVWFTFDKAIREPEFPAVITFRQPYYRSGNKLRFYYAPVFSNHNKAGVTTADPSKFVATLTWLDGLTPKILKSSSVIERGAEYVRLALAHRAPIIVEVSARLH
jgi:hypothetical protein